jgi:formylglycine-generating enzyme
MRLRGFSPGIWLLGAASVLGSCGAIAFFASGSNAKPKKPTAARTTTSAAPRVATPAKAAGPCPPEMALVESTCVDRYEAHVLEAGEGGRLVLHPPHQLLEKKRYVAASSAGVKPQAFVCQVDAAAACENAGKRLCSLTEWYRACTGAAKTTYPYGAKYEKGRCNVGKPHLLSILHGASVARWSYENFNDPRLAQTEGFLALSGEYTGCSSGEGVMDLVGNLHEWVADKVDASLKTKLPVPAIVQRRIGKHPGNGIFMGGFFSTLSQHGDGCQYVTAAHDPHYHDYSTGFRCCQDAAP